MQQTNVQTQVEPLQGDAEEPEQGVVAIQYIMMHLIAKLGFSPVSDVQVLCPMTRGEVGTRNLNQELQQLLSPPSGGKAEITRGGMTLRVREIMLT